MANTYIHRGDEYTINPQAESLPEGHADTMTCSECGGPGFFRKASENKVAHFVHHPVCRFMFPDCNKLSVFNFSKKDKKIIYEGNQETFNNYLSKRTKAELEEIIKLLKMGPIANFYKREVELVEGYKEKQKELRQKNHEISEYIGRIRELTGEVQHLHEVIQEVEEADPEKIKALIKLFNFNGLLFKVKLNKNGQVWVEEMTIDKVIKRLEEIICLLA